MVVSVSPGAQFRSPDCRVLIYIFIPQTYFAKMEFQLDQHDDYLLTMTFASSCILTNTRPKIECQIPYSGKFSPGKNFAKARANVLQKKIARFIFAQPG